MVHLIGETEVEKETKSRDVEKKSMAVEKAVQEALDHIDKFINGSCRVTLLIRNPNDSDQNHYFISNDDEEFKERIRRNIWPAVEG